MAVATLLATFSLSAQPNQATGNKQNPAAQPPPIAVLGAPEKKNGGDKDQSESSADAPRWYTSLKDPNWMLVIAAFATCGVICWQSIATARAAKASQRSVDVVIAKERARMKISPTHLRLHRWNPREEFKAIQADLHVTNDGILRAFVTESVAKLYVTDSEASPPREATGSSFDSLCLDDLFPPTDVPKAVSIYWTDIGENDSLAAIKDDVTSGRRFIHIEGFVEYLTFDEKWRWDFQCTWQRSQLYGLLGQISPDDFSGYWKQCGSKNDNGERKIRPPSRLQRIFVRLKPN